jgi:predicted Zn-dependent protease
MGEALVEQNEYADAEPFLKKSLNAKPQYLPHVHALLGRLYANTGKRPDAIKQLKMGLSSDEDGSVHYELARLYFQSRDKKDAEVALEQMKSLQRNRRETATIAIRDSHSTTLDDGP